MSPLIVRLGMLLTAWLVCAGGPASAAPFHGTRYVGSLESHIGISMSLTQIGEQVQGTYAYNTVGTPLELVGTIVDDQLFLEEFDSAGEQTGQFDLERVSAHLLVGYWSGPGSEESLAVVLVARDGKDIDPCAVPLEAMELEVRGLSAEEPEYGFSLPIVTGADWSVDLNPVQEAIRPEQVFHDSLENLLIDYALPRGLTGLSYHVNFNEHGLLDIVYYADWMGAYPSTSRHQQVIDLRSGRQLTAADLFGADQLREVRALVEPLFEEAVREAIAEAQTDGGDILDLLDGAEFSEADLDLFSLSPWGVTFRYAFGFPHVARAGEPRSEYHLSYAELRPYIRPEGPLGYALN